MFGKVDTTETYQMSVQIGGGKQWRQNPVPFGARPTPAANSHRAYGAELRWSPRRVSGDEVGEGFLFLLHV